VARQIADGGKGIEVLERKNAEGGRGVQDVGSLGVEAAGGTEDGDAAFIGIGRAAKENEGVDAISEFAGEFEKGEWFL
jgi:hypothetical protein